MYWEISLKNIIKWFLENWLKNCPEQYFKRYVKTLNVNRKKCLIIVPLEYIWFDESLKEKHETNFMIIL